MKNDDKRERRSASFALEHRYRMRSRATPALLCLSFACLACLAHSPRASAGGATPERALRFPPGHEEAILALFGPGPIEDVRCAGWVIASVRPGPACEVSLDLREDGSGATRTVALRPRTTAAAPGGASVAIETDGTTPAPAPTPAGGAGAPAAGSGDAVLACLAAILAPNDPGDFFAGKCEEGRSDVPGADDEAYRAAAEGAARGYPFGYLRTLLFVGAIVAGLLLLGRRREGDSGATLAPPSLRPSRRESWTFVALAGAALLVRSRLMAILGPGHMEMENFGVGILFDGLARQTCALSGDWSCDFGAAYHPPLLQTLLDLWLPLGDVFDIGGTRVWLRLPNLALEAAFLWLLVRTGRVAGAPAAGWAAAVLAGFLPRMVTLSVYQGPYFAEMVATAWFLERLATYVLARRAVHRSLILAAAAAIWTGYMSALVVGPGLLLYLGVTLARGERRATLASVLLFAGLVAPIAGSALDTVVRYSSISVAGSPSAIDQALLQATQHHSAIDMSQIADPARRQFLRFGPLVAERLLGAGGPWLALAGLLALFARRPRAAWFPLLLAAGFAGAWGAIYLRWQNVTSVYPVVLFAPLWGLASLPRPTIGRLRIPLPQAACVAVVALALPLTFARAWGQTWGTSAGGLADWAWGGSDVVSLSARLRAPDQRSTPVLLLAMRQYAHLLCTDRGPRAARDDCRAVVVARTWDPDTLLDLSVVGGHPVAQFNLSNSRLSVDHATCPRVDRLVSREPWSQQPRFVLVTRDFADATGGACAESLTPPSCRLEGATPMERLYRCPPPTEP